MLTVNRNFLLREKVRNTKMKKKKGIVSYLTKIKLVKDKLAAFGEKIDDDELMRTALNGFSKQWDVFVQID